MEMVEFMNEDNEAKLMMKPYGMSEHDWNNWTLEMAGKHFMKWISVEERLPEEFTRVLISCSEGICAGKLTYGQWQCDPIGSYAGDGCVWDVSHWMPLPEPPKEI